MSKRRLLLALAVTAGLSAGAAPAANAQSIWGNGSPVSGTSPGWQTFSVAGGNAVLRCKVTATAAPVIGPVASAPFTISYTSCTITIAGIARAATVTVANPWTWNVSGGTFNPGTGVWAGTSVTMPGALNITVPSIGCLITVPPGTALTAGGTNSGTPWSGTSMNLTRTGIAWTSNGLCFGLPVAGADGTYSGVIIWVNWWDP